MLCGPATVRTGSMASAACLLAITTVQQTLTDATAPGESGLLFFAVYCQRCSTKFSEMSDNEQEIHSRKYRRDTALVIG
jgi:hypothetical protein